MARQCCTFSSCMCGISLRDGSLTIAVVMIIVSILRLVYAVANIYYSRNEAWFGLLVEVINIPLAIMLFFAVLREKTATALLVDLEHVRPRRRLLHLRLPHPRRHRQLLGRRRQHIHGHRAAHLRAGHPLLHALVPRRAPSPRSPPWEEHQTLANECLSLCVNTSVNYVNVYNFYRA
ncbi:uncharacterized protein LOC119591615 [Penaeus monodon]|uniref:uncharacterized protein LOC119591615 n=1 Tax=Penaeus monodon TaxID=6687 RepID=UPI0018A7D3B5|nr:uncharacterized protein LOC119591615 [Penaeus monodon]